MLEVLPKVAKMKASYALGKPLALPMNLTISVSYRCNSRCKTCNVWQRPANGIQDKIIPGRIERVRQAAPTSEVIINLSLDGVGEKHDIVRGVKGNFERAMRTYAGLKVLKGRYKNFTLGVHTVISNFNVDEFENIYAFVRDELKPDSFI